MLLLTSLPLLLAAQTAPRIERDIPYAQPKNERRLLDIYIGRETDRKSVV